MSVISDAMTIEELHCDIAHVLQNRDFTILQKLLSHCYNFRAEIAAKVDDTTAYEIECLEKRALNVNKITELQQEVEGLKTELDATKLQQKIIDKKILNAVKKQEELKEEVEVEKLRRDSLSIEMIDLQQESKKRNENKLLTWNAIKRACCIYKQYLDIRIQLNDKEHKHITISFFINNIATKDKYFVELVNTNNHWQVEEIHPVLGTEYLSDLKGIVDFSKESQVSNMSAFLCKLRHIFVKYYLHTK